MNRSEHLLATLRQVVRNRGIKYQELADKLGISLVTVKRFFNQGSDVSLERLESMCIAAGLDLYELVEMARQEQARFSLTAEQEELLTDEKVLAAFFSATCGLNRLHIKSFGGHTDAEIDAALKILEQHGMIERHSHGRLKSRFTMFSLRWIPDGPFERCYGQKSSASFFHEAFNGGSGYSGFRQIYLTPSSLENLALKLDQLLKEAVTMADVDVKKDVMNVASVGVLLAAEPWVPEILRSFYQPDAACDSRLREQCIASRDSTLTVLSGSE